MKRKVSMRRTIRRGGKEEEEERRKQQRERTGRIMRETLRQKTQKNIDREWMD